MGHLRLELGRAGSGKSTRICTAIAEELQKAPLASRIFLVVPSDASYAAERMLMAKIDASVRAEVITLRRLAERASSALGVVTERATTVTGKRLLLSEIYQTYLPQLQTLVRDRPSVAFLDSILAAFSEMTAYQIDLEQISSLLEVAATEIRTWPAPRAMVAGRSLLGKLHDLCLLYAKWKTAMRERELADSDELLQYVSPHLGSWPQLRDAIVYFDGFMTSTPQELHFILQIAKVARETTITLAMDADWLQTAAGAASGAHTASVPNLASAAGGVSPAVAALLGDVTGEAVESLIDLVERTMNPSHVFAPQTLQFYYDIVQACEELDVSYDVKSRQPERASTRFQNWELAHLEQALFTGKTRNEHQKCKYVHLAAAQNARAETDGAAQEICRVVQARGLDYSEVAVVVPDLTLYAPYLRDSFNRYDIPLYMDDFPSFATHPLAKFVLASMQVVEESYSLESIARLLKSDFCGLYREQADWLESYLRRYEISGVAAFAKKDSWSFAADSRAAKSDALAKDDERADELRRRFNERMLAFYDALKFPVCTPFEFATAIWQLLERVDSKRIVAEWVVNEDASESPQDASVHEQAWQRLLDLMNDLASPHAKGELARTFLFEVVKKDIVGATLATIPAGVNEVLITELARARAWEAKVVFILGTAVGAFPIQHHPAGLLQDEERRQFAVLFGRRLGLTTEERQLCERATTYFALTRSTSELFITYPLASSEGKELRRSMWVDRIQQLYAQDSLQEVLWVAERGAAGAGGAFDVSTLTERTAIEWLIFALRSDAEATAYPRQLLAVFNWFRQTPERLVRLQRALAGLTHKTGAVRLPVDVAKALYGHPLKLSAYRLETFAVCPFRHFVQYGLRLQPEETPEVTPALRGTLVHDLLLRFVQRESEDIAAWRNLTDEEAVQAMREAFQAAMADPEFAPWLRQEARAEQARAALAVLEEAAIVLTEHARHGAFQPSAIELSFGTRDPGSLPAFEISLGSGKTVELRGRIDRVDTASNSARHAFRIIDYKSSVLKIDLTRVAHGLQLQLPLYSAVIEHFSEDLFHQHSEPAGMVYIPIIHHVKLKNMPVKDGLARQEVVEAMRAHGLLVEDMELVTWMDARLTSTFDSELFPKVYNKNNTVAKAASVLGAEDWKLVIARALAHVREFSERMLQGDISIAPYYLSATDNGAISCPYLSICQFDKRCDGHLYRRLAKFDRERVSEEWKVFVDGGDGHATT